MIPILYDKRETDFDSVGIGALRDTISCVVTEERNGLFDMTMKYPVSGEYFNEIGLESIIVCDASPILTNQQFVVAKITRPINKVVTIYAEHVSQYKTKTTTLKPEVSFTGNAKNALTAWNESLLVDQDFTVDSDIGTTMQGHWTIDKVENSRRALGGVEGSILDLYGGEYLFDNNKIKLLKNRGVDRGVYISYGRNLTTIEQEEAITNTVTSIQPFVTYFVDGGTEEKTLTLPENVIHSGYVNNYAKPKILRVNFSGEEIKTVDTLRTRAERYITENRVGVPKVNLTVSFVDLTQTIEYQNQDVYEEINLCDEVTVEFEEYGIEEKAKIVKTKYNALLDRYDILEIGSLRNSYKSTLDSITDKIEENKTVVNSKITQIREEILKDYFSDQAYTYNLETGNEYGLPAGTYSYDRPIDQNPTKVIYLGAGKLMIANSKTTDGMWDFATMATGDGLVGDTIVSNSITVNKLAADVGQELDISSNTAITSRVTKTEILTDPEIRDALKGEDGKPGEPGEKGDPGESITIKGSLDSVDELPPTANEGDVYSVVGADGTTITLYSYTGGKWINIGQLEGGQGTSVSKVTPQYYRSTSKTSVTGGSWGTALPAWKKNTYIWTRLKIDYVNPTKTEDTEPVLDTVNNALNEVYDSGIILPSQKPQLLIKLAEIVEEYKVLDTEENKKLDEWSAYQSAYTSLSSTLSVLTNDMSATSELDPANFKTLNETYATVYNNLSKAIDNKLAQDLDTLKSRVTEAETKITDESILATVRASNEFASGAVTEQISTLEQTVEGFTASLNLTQQRLDDLSEDTGNIRNYLTFSQDSNGNPYTEMGSSKDALKLRQWRNRISFMNGEIEEAYFSNQAMHVKTVRTGRYEFTSPSETVFEAWYREE